MEKDTKKFIAHMLEKGYVLKLLRQGKHYIFRASKNGRSMTLTLSKSPADHRAYKNAETILKRGLL